MSEIVLTRSAQDRKRFDLSGVGFLRKSGNFLSETHEAHAEDGRSWTLNKVGWTWSKTEAREPNGNIAGSSERKKVLNHGGELTWGREHYEIVNDSNWKTRYHLRGMRGDLVSVESKGWGKQPTKLELLTEQTLDPGLLLYFVWLVGTFAAEDTATVATAT